MRVCVCVCVCVCMCVCACVCPCPRLLITNGIIWCDMNTETVAVIVNGHGHGIDTCREN